MMEIGNDQHTGEEEEEIKMPTNVKVQGLIYALRN
jgi:hypothetical protein